MSLRLAIVGSGQLARMMALDGIPLGIQFSFLTEDGEDTRCVNGLGDIITLTSDISADDLFEQLGKPDAITVEKEHVDVDLLSALEAMCPVYPSPRALEKFKNRREEKCFLQSLNIPIAPFHSVQSEQDFANALAQLSQPVFLKSEEEGYDGYNQYRVTDDNRDEVLAALTFPSQWVAESFIPFDREVSFIAARSRDGKYEFYPVAENDHHDGTLLTSLAPAPNFSESQVAQGREYLRSMMDALDYVGVMCMECFVWGDKLLVNEIAPRVHNSGHWTSKGALTSQFENHVRAVTGLPLGSIESHGISGMLNLLGVTLSAEQACDHESFLTLYGKTVRPRRKLGHVTVKGIDYSDVSTRLRNLEQTAYGKVHKP